MVSLLRCFEQLFFWRTMTEKRKMFDHVEIEKAIYKMAKQIVSSFSPSDDSDFILVGLYKQGVPLAERLRDEIENISGYRSEVGKLDISMYRDDVGLRSGLPLIRETIMPINTDGSRILLVDDVLSSGRTIRAALDAITDYGRPAYIRLAVLVDRGNPEYPIAADVVGITVDIPDERKVKVELANDEDNCSEDAIFEIEWEIE